MLASDETSHWWIPSGLGLEGRQGGGEGPSGGVLRWGQGGQAGGEVPRNCLALRHGDEHGCTRGCEISTHTPTHPMQVLHLLRRISCPQHQDGCVGTHYYRVSFSNKSCADCVASNS